MNNYFSNVVYYKQEAGLPSNNSQSSKKPKNIMCPICYE